MRISLIVAMAENRVIGKDGAMPWHLSADLKYFKRVTLGAPVVMGRKTFDSIGRALPGRTNLIVTRDVNFIAEGIEVVHDLDSAIVRAKSVAKADDKEEVFVIGGAQIYELALPLADRLYITEIHRSCDGDTVFPDIDPTDWQEVGRQPHQPESSGGPAFSFVKWDRRH